MLPADDSTLAPVRASLAALGSELASVGASPLPGSLGLDWAADGPDPATMSFMGGPADAAAVAALVSTSRDWANAAAAAVLVYAIANPPAAGAAGIVTRVYNAARDVHNTVRNGLMTWARSLPTRLAGALWRWADFAWTAVGALGRALGGGASLFGGGFATALLLGLVVFLMTRKG